MSAPRPEGLAVAAPRAPFRIPTDVVGVALVTEAAPDNHITVDTFDLEATFRQVAAGLGFGVLSHAAALFVLSAFLRRPSDAGAPFR
jgi:hypothetical protein